MKTSLSHPQVEKTDVGHHTTMDLTEAEGVIKSLAGVFEANPQALELAALFLEYGSGTTLSREQSPNLDARYRTLVEQIPAVIFMAFLEKGIGEAYVSPHIESVLGFSQEEWLNDPVRWYRQIHPEDKERWSLEAAQMLVSGKPLRSVYRVLARDGRVVWFQCEAKMVRDEDGRPWFMHGIAFDITELKETQAQLQKANEIAESRARELESGNLELRFQIAEREEAEEKLRESEEKFRSLVGGVRDYAIFLLDPAGRVVNWNPGAQYIHGYSADEITGAHISKFYLKEDIRKGEPERALKIAQIEGRYETEGWRVRKNGSKFWGNVIITALRYKTGQLYGFAKVTRDMTERKAMQDKLQEAERLATMGTTAAVFAHEIGNPLNGISTSLQFLRHYMAKHKKTGDALVDSTLESALKEIDHLAFLLDDFRSLAKPQQLDSRPTDLGQLVAEFLATAAAQYAEKGIEVKRDFPADLPWVTADSRRLKQVLFNFCKNAVEAMPGGGKLTIRGRHFNGLISLEISDTGVGIPDDFPVFELFKTSKEHGTGLGLAIVRQIISAHQGTISYRSELGKGTTFTISLPLDPEQSHYQPAHHADDSDSRRQ
ncbi:MAG: PAS domain S-box protein [Candidatus Binatia bacterium]